MGAAFQTVIADTGDSRAPVHRKARVGECGVDGGALPLPAIDPWITDFYSK